MALMIQKRRRQWVVLELGVVGWIFGDGWRHGMVHEIRDDDHG